MKIKKTCKSCGNGFEVFNYRENDSNETITERGYSKLIDYGDDIVITHIPKKTQIQLLELAKEFNDELNMTLKYLVDFYSGMIPNQNDIILAEIEGIKNELESLKQEKNE